MSLTLSFKYLLKTYLSGVIIFTVLRLLFLYCNRASLQHIPPNVALWAKSLFMGLRFDTVISCYILVLPGLLLIIAGAFGSLRKRFFFFLHSLISLLYLITFFACFADIPFFMNFGARLNITALTWSHAPMFMLKMIFEEKSFLFFLLLFLFTAFAWLWYRRMVYRLTVAAIEKDLVPAHKWAKLVPAVVLFTLCMLLGIRGRVAQKTTIHTGTAYFCAYDILNQAALNPVFTFISSYLEAQKPENSTLHLMDDDTAIKLCRASLGIHDTGTASLLLRNISAATPDERHNVVLVIMESMAARYLQRFGNKDRLTPNLDTLAQRGYSFDNFYSAGMHTYNGIFSTLYSFPALMAKHAMLSDPIPHYTGLPYLMKAHGYNTIYFTTHDDQFDNVGGFLRANYVDKVYSQTDYASAEVLNALGVPDDYLFSYAIPVLNSYHHTGKPFFSTIMTVTNHPPFEVPPSSAFKPGHTEVRGGCVEYADHAIGSFMQQAAKQPWYNNTVFVFVADHGTWGDDFYGSLHLELNHIPCIIYSPLIHEPRSFNMPGGQIDLFPTIAGLLHFSYINNTPGIDLLHEHRPWMYFGQDDKVGVVDAATVYEWERNGHEGLYRRSDKQDFLREHRRLADSMRSYAHAMMQTAQWMSLHKLTGAPATLH